MKHEIKKSCYNFKYIIFSYLSCGPIYLPALWDSAPPVSAPTEVKKESKFLSAYFNKSGGFNKGDENRFFRANLVKAKGENWYKFSGGGFAYFGSYNVQNPLELEQNKGEKLYISIGADIDLNLFMSLRFFNLGIGTYSGFAGEFGKYTSFRKASPIVPFISTYFLLQFNLSEKDKFSFRAGLGLPGFLNLSYYNIDYGGLWIGWSTSEREVGNELGISSVGFSIKIK